MYPVWREWLWFKNYDDIIDGIAGFLKQLNQIILIRFKRSVIVQKNINSSICGFGNRKSRCGQIGINQNDYWFHSINMYFLNYFNKKYLIYYSKKLQWPMRIQQILSNPLFCTCTGQPYQGTPYNVFIHRLDLTKIIPFMNYGII